ncbi:hypothetical protein [Fimbriiglobus ruber]|uniref:hypothetical protein n=1 Tax=Fimbriiglobus ruber TaxID=1908690 RepID=UPI000B4BAF9E|nr:hypothetical protein [Fimbriiglobus ruber]
MGVFSAAGWGAATGADSGLPFDFVGRVVPPTKDASTARTTAKTPRFGTIDSQFDLASLVMRAHWLRGGLPVPSVAREWLSYR